MKYYPSEKAEVLEIEPEENVIEVIPDIKVIYYLLTGLSYREIGIRFYYHNTNKFIYRVRKLMKKFHLVNRRHLAYFAVKNHLIDVERLKDLQNA